MYHMHVSYTISRGMGGSDQQTFCGRDIGIFWSNTIINQLLKAATSHTRFHKDQEFF